MWYNIFMLYQKIYKSGNSVVVSIPKEYLRNSNLRDGAEIMLDQDIKTGIITIARRRDVRSGSTITPKFLKWLESFNKEYGPALQELAKR